MMERKRFWKPSSILSSDSPPTAAVTSPDRFSAATAPAALSATAAVSVGQRLLTSGGESRAGALAAARRLIIPLGSFLPARRVGRAVFDPRRVLPGPGLRARRGRRGFDLAGPLLHLPPDALQRRRDPFRQGITTLRCLLSHLRLYRAFTEEEVHRHLAPASDPESSRSTSAPRSMRLLPSSPARYPSASKVPPPPGYSSVARIRWPGVPSTDGPSIEAPTTGGRYSGRLSTFESHAKTSFGGASMVWVCSYSFTPRSFRNAP